MYLVAATKKTEPAATSIVSPELVNFARPGRGKPVYTGIANNLKRRGAQHGARFDQLEAVTDAPVTRGQARASEQALIARDPSFENKINSISPTHSYYNDAVSWGEACEALGIPRASGGA